MVCVGAYPYESDFRLETGLAAEERRPRFFSPASISAILLRSKGIWAASHAESDGLDRLELSSLEAAQAVGGTRTIPRHGCAKTVLYMTLDKRGEDCCCVRGD